MEGIANLFITQHGHPQNAKDSEIDLHLEDLNITYASGATGSVVTYFGGSDNGPSFVNLTATNCNIDASAAGKATIFNFNQPTSNSDVDFVMTGGSIEGNANTTVFEQNYPGDAITFLPDANGNYTTFIFADNTQLNGVYYSETANKYLEFGAPAVNSDGKYVSTLVVAEEILTAYGAIPKEYQDASKYPFVIFKDGEFKTAVDSTTSNWWRTIFNTTLNTDALRSGCTILARANVKTSGDTWNLCYVKDVTIDLANFTFENSGGFIFHARGRDEAVHETKITVKNGTFKTKNDAAAIVVFSNENTNSSHDNFYFTFDGVKFDISNSGLQYNGQSNIGVCLVDSYSNGAGGAGGTVTYNNCEIIDNGTVAEKKVLFNLEDASSKNKNDISVVINGGTYTTNSIDNLFAVATLDKARTATEGAPDSFAIGKDFYGNVLKVVLPSGYAVPEIKYPFSDGNYMLSKTSVSGANAYYSFVNVTTEYGDIEYKWLNADDYPFIVFKDNVAIHAFKDWSKFISGITATAGETYKTGCTILLRRDYSTEESASSTSNWGYITKITVDLGQKFIKSFR